jgi:two-component system sensor histidine kinase KdpD
MMYLLVALISSALTYKIRQLQKIYRQKEDRANAIMLYNTLLNSLSHELRTPIAIIIGAADNLQQPNAGLTQHYRDELVAEIAKASMKLNHHVDNLLNMSRLESGVVMPRGDWCDIGELIHDIAGKVEEQVTGRRIEVIISPDIPLAQIDKGMLEQILYNLVSNAAIYTPVQCRIVVRAYCDDEVLVMEIEDNGPGFPADEIDKVFDKFYRLKHSVTGGTGLGLSIVKGFAEAMEGDVTLEQIKEGGAKFTVRLPAPLSYLKNLKNE